MARDLLCNEEVFGERREERLRFKPGCYESHNKSHTLRNMGHLLSMQIGRNQYPRNFQQTGPLLVSGVTTGHEPQA